MSGPVGSEPEYEERPDELDQLLDQLPKEVALLISERWSKVQPGRHSYWATCEIARIFADGVTPQGLRLADLAMQLAAIVEDLEIDAAGSWYRAMQNTNLAQQRAEMSSAVRRDHTADRDAAIRAAWRQKEGIASKSQRAQAVIITLKTRARAERWAMPGKRQIIRIAEQN